MKSFEVTIRATVTKTLVVQGETEQKASEVARDLFTTVCDGDEDYKEETLSVTQTPMEPA